MSIIPCADGAKAMSKVKTEIQKSNHQQTNRTTKDACSPFCICTCCAGFPVPQKIAKLIPVKPELIKRYNTFYSSFIKEISLSIWQPPQLA